MSSAAKLRDLEARYIPRKKPSKYTKKAAWMSYKAVKLVHKKHRLYIKYKNEHHLAYTKAARETDIEIWHKSFEKKLAEQIDMDHKSFYAYVRNLSHAKPPIATLFCDNQVLIEQDQMAEEFNKYFTSVFTIKNTANIPTTMPLFHGDDNDRLCNMNTARPPVKYRRSGNPTGN